MAKSAIRKSEDDSCNNEENQSFLKVVEVCEDQSLEWEKISNHLKNRILYFTREAHGKGLLRSNDPVEIEIMDVFVSEFNNFLYTLECLCRCLKEQKLETQELWSDLLNTVASSKKENWNKDIQGEVRVYFLYQRNEEKLNSLTIKERAEIETIGISIIISILNFCEEIEVILKDTS